MDTEHDMHGDTLRAGAGVGDITPPVGAELSGGAFGRSRAVLDPLRVKVLCLEDGAVRLALATFDLLGMDPFAPPSPLPAACRPRR